MPARRRRTPAAVSELRGRLAAHAGRQLAAMGVRPPRPSVRGGGSTEWEHISVRKMGLPPGHGLGARYASARGEYAKYYLIDGHDTNGNDWGVPAESIPSQIGSFIGKPFVITSDEWIGSSPYGSEYDHPFVDTNHLPTIYSHQNRFRVGDIVKVAQDHDDGRWYAAVRMLPKYRGRSLPPYCSPAVYKLDEGEADDKISRWTGLHLAGLHSRPAYGIRVALFKGKCTGMHGECMTQFRMTDGPGGR